METIMNRSALLIFAAQTIIFSLLVVPTFGQQAIGIFDDPAQFDMVKSHIDNIEKALNEIKVLSADPNRDYNKLVGWINLKNDQIDKLSEIISGYFIAQRLAPVRPDSREFGDYLKQLRLFHEVLYYANQCKQFTDIEYVKKARASFNEARRVYFEIHGNG